MAISQEWFESNEFEALKLRYEDQTQLLRFMTQVDMRLFSGYVTLQMAFGAWLATQRIEVPTIKLGLLILDVALGALCSLLLFNNYQRRKDVAGTVSNLNRALGYSLPGVYLPEKTLNVDRPTHRWPHWYLVGVALGIIGIFLIVLGS